jgi:hypothetical protein
MAMDAVRHLLQGCQVSHPAATCSSKHADAHSSSRCSNATPAALW